MLDHRSRSVNGTMVDFDKKGCQRGGNMTLGHAVLFEYGPAQHPNSAWVKRQTEAFIEQTADRTEMPSIVMHDRDTKFTQEIVAVLKANGIRTNALPVASPNHNGRVERFIQSIKRECLGKFILFGRRHLDHIAAEWVE